ncbi:hypothetical protein [Spirulina sp. 06S082]|uniref:hypothetical protein n=1 Tax=Spirulina sp. 06S082 TaxID=3110248 RepID=UPI002B213F59|nr:hypothetical protein [Spirulina sp. 06S082]MEA5467994.1 hypothetical protein [Spirulina sp. 06S082]
MKNVFIQAMGVGAAVYIALLLLDLILTNVLRFLQTFASWYQISGVRYAGWAAGGAFALYLLFAAVFSSREE